MTFYKVLTKHQALIYLRYTRYFSLNLSSSQWERYH